MRSNASSARLPLIPFIGVAAAAILGGLVLLRPLFGVHPTTLTLVEGAERKLAAPPDSFLELTPAATRAVRVFRDPAGRIHVAAVRAGRARLRVFSDGRLARHVDIEVTKAKLRKIEVTPALRELLARQTEENEDPKRVAERPRADDPLAPMVRPPEPPRPDVDRPKVEPRTLPDKVAERATMPEPKREPPKKKPEKQPRKEKATARKPLDVVLQPPRPPEPKPPGKKVVELDAPNKKKPKQANYLAQEDSAVEKETRARKTTLVKTAPGDEQPNSVGHKERPGEEKARFAEDEDKAPNQAEERRMGKQKKEAIAEIPATVAPPPTAPASVALPGKQERETRILAPGGRERTRPQPQGEVNDRGQEIVDDFPTGPPRRFRPFPSAVEIARILREYPGPARKGQRGQEAESGDDESGAQTSGKGVASRMPGGSAKWRKIWQRVRGFLENFIPEVSPGTHTALNAQRSTFAAYIARAHRKVHVEWGFGLWNRFRTLGSYYPGMTAIYSRLELKLNRRGKVLRVGLVHTSGSTEFDGATMASVLSAAPFGPPPEDMVSKDGITYIHWTFFQDGRQCWTNDVQIFVNDEPQK